MEILYIVAGKDWLESLFIFYLYLSAANVLSRTCSKHTVEPPEWVQDIFVMTRNIDGHFSICGVIWGTVTYVSWIAFLIGRVLVGLLYSLESYSEVTAVIIRCEFIFILVPLLIYHFVAWRRSEREYARKNQG